MLVIYSLTIIFKNYHFKNLIIFLLSFYLLIHISFLTNHIYKKEENIRWTYNNNQLSKMILGYQFPKPINFEVKRYDNLVNFLKKDENKYAYKN